MHRVKLSTLGVVLSFCASLFFLPDLLAKQKERASKEPGVDVPSFTCGECPGGSTPLTGAGWQLCWRQAPQQGLVIRNVCFQRQQVLFEASQPFVIVPYHDLSAQFKDGLGPTCGGVAYVLITPTVAALEPDDENPGYPASSGFPAAPAYDKLELAATYDTFNYRYRQRWIFHGTGDIDAMFGIGGYLLPGLFNVAHIHSPYWRLDFDIDDFDVNYVEEFNHPNLLTPDGRTPLLVDGPRIGDPAQFQKWTVRSNSVNAQGQFHSWDIEPLLGRLTSHTTADFWALTFNPAASEQGVEVGTTDCTDTELSTLYTKGNSVDGADLVVWVSASAHHEPRDMGEEGGGQPFNLKRMPGHEWFGIHISPRNFLNTTPIP